MGVCLSCLRGRDSAKVSRGRPDESQPLLDDGNDVYGTQYGSDSQADQLAQRQQELTQLVQTTHEYFIDVSSMAQPETLEVSNPDAPTDTAALASRIKQKLSVAPVLPQLRPLTDGERAQLARDLPDLP